VGSKYTFDFKSSGIQTTSGSLSQCKAEAGFGVMTSYTVSDCKCDSNRLCEVTIA